MTTKDEQIPKAVSTFKLMHNALSVAGIRFVVVVVVVVGRNRNCRIYL